MACLRVAQESLRMFILRVDGPLYSVCVSKVNEELGLGGSK